jgi:hypothetical protein
LFILKGDNQQKNNYLDKVAQIAKQFNQKLFPINTGYSSKGPDLGADELKLIKAPRIAVLRTDQTSSYSYGEVWHFFEQALGYPLIQVNQKSLSSALDHIDQLILPNGYYTKWNENNFTDKLLLDWVEDGGKIIALSGALNRFADTTTFKLKKKKEEELDTTEIPFGDQSRNEISLITTGSIFKAQLDTSHPLSFGLEQYYTLKLNENAYEFLDNGNNALTLGSNVKAVAGFIGFRAIGNQSKSLLFGEESIGKGSVVYFVDNVLFRGFWYSGKMALTNALFFL